MTGREGVMVTNWAEVERCCMGARKGHSTGAVTVSVTPCDVVAFDCVFFCDELRSCQSELEPDLLSCIWALLQSQALARANLLGRGNIAYL